VVQWSFNIGCSNSPVGDLPKLWCGSGWTGQPAVFRAPGSGQWSVAFGGYDQAVHFLDPATGAERHPGYVTGDIIKGSITIDPDGFPLLYTGSRDNYFHVVALDRPQPEALWQLWAHEIEPTLWNNDWDGSALVVDDHLLIGGENGRFYVVRLNRSFGEDGLVQVAPQIVFSTESWDDQLLADIGDTDVSVENSVALSGDTVYFANSGGRIQGWHLGTIDSGGTPERVFEFWTGDDTDATIVIDGEGMLYAGSQYERGNQRSAQLGQIFKLDPSKPADPLVWSVAANEGLGSGVWATPALHDDLVIVATDGGAVLALDRATGAERWRLGLTGPLWSSPVVVDGVLLQADCGGRLHAFDLSSGSPAGPPAELWSVELDGCLESTPAVWDGQIFLGSRGGRFYAIGDIATITS
jgi:outer membrane protein assembly factor BamB